MKYNNKWNRVNKRMIKRDKKNRKNQKQPRFSCNRIQMKQNR